MTNISKRDLLKTLPAVVPATLLGGVSLPALANQHGSITINVLGDGAAFYLDCPADSVSHASSSEEITNPTVERICRSLFGDSDVTSEKRELCEKGLEFVRQNPDLVVEVISYAVAGGTVYKALKLGARVLFSLFR